MIGPHKDHGPNTEHKRGNMAGIKNRGSQTHRDRTKYQRSDFSDSSGDLYFECGHHFNSRSLPCHRKERDQLLSKIGAYVPN